MRVQRAVRRSMVVAGESANAVHGAAARYGYAAARRSAGSVSPQAGVQWRGSGGVAVQQVRSAVCGAQCAQCSVRAVWCRRQSEANGDKSKPYRQKIET